MSNKNVDTHIDILYLTSYVIWSYVFNDLNDICVIEWYQHMPNVSKRINIMGVNLLCIFGNILCISDLQFRWGRYASNLYWSKDEIPKSKFKRLDGLFQILNVRHWWVIESNVFLVYYWHFSDKIQFLCMSACVWGFVCHMRIMHFLCNMTYLNIV